MSKRDLFKTIAEDTLKIVNNGYFTNDKNERIEIMDKVNYSVDNTVLYSPKKTDEILNNSNSQDFYLTQIEVTDETTLQAIKRLKDSGENRIAALNFASARNPGGGFLNGSSAQEESLARSTSLYASISKQKEMYDFNNKNRSRLYSDYMIYSPDVAILKDDNGNLHDVVYTSSFITSPAVNKGSILQREKHVSVNQIHSVMKKRIEKILSIALLHKHENIILGAYGCGVFKNNPQDVAGYFYDILKNNEKFQNKFNHIVFAVVDFSPNKETYYAFKNKFN